MLFTFCNTLYQQSIYLQSPLSSAPISKLVGKKTAEASKAWIYIMVSVDALIGIGLGVWVYFCFFHKQKEKKVEE
jgi:hypothetical protein